jgi:hypothetical protein
MKSNKPPEEEIKKLMQMESIQRNFLNGCRSKSTNQLADINAQVTGSEPPAVYGHFEINEIDEINDINGLLSDLQTSEKDMSSAELEIIRILHGSNDLKKCHSHCYTIDENKSFVASHPKISMSGRIVYSSSDKNLSVTIGGAKGLRCDVRPNFRPERVTNPFVKNFM